MSENRALQALVQALGVLPGVGTKSASRMAHHLLGHDRVGALRLSQALAHAVEVVRHCKQCNTLSETEVCGLCADVRRNASRLCVVETPADQDALEKTKAFDGYYFVLMGRLSPLDGLGAKDIGLKKLFDRVFDEHPAGEESAKSLVVKELILATNFTAEGEATAHVIAQALKGSGVKVTRLAKGVPAGSELEYVDLSSLAHAMVDRREH
jgi:recombination protein RecR